MSTGPTVRDARPDEFAALATLTVAAYRGVLAGALRGPYLAELADVAGRARMAEVLVAVDDAARLVGSVTYLPGAGPLASIGHDEAAIRYLAVDPEAQARGVGAALVAACIERARAGGKARLTLHTTEPMTAAQRLYERAGFRRHPGRDVELESGLVLLAYVLELGR